MNGRKENLSRGLEAALLYGLLWGIFEATAGHIIHLVRVPGLAGLVMVPAALFFLSRAFLASGKSEAVFLTGCIAAGLKFLDLLIPGRDIAAVVNPAQFILLESLAMSYIFSLRKIRLFSTTRPAGGPAPKNRETPPQE